MHTSRKLFSAAAVGLISRIAGIIIRFISLPLMLSILSKERYGLWLIILSLVGWLGMSDLGIPSALQNRLIQLKAGKYFDRENALFVYGLKLLTTIGLIIFVILGFASFFAPIGHLFLVKPGLAREFRFSLLLCLFSFAFGLPLRLGSVLFNANGRLIAPPVIDLLGTLFSFSMLIAAVLFKWNSLLALACCNLAGLMAGGLVGTIVATRTMGYKLKTAAAAPEDKKVLSQKGFFFLVTTVGELMILQTDAFLIGIMLGADKVQLYLIPATLFINFLQLQNIWLKPLWPVLTRLRADNDRIELKRYFINTMLSSVGAATVFGIAIIFIGDSFIRLWSKGASGVSPTMAWGLAANVITASVDNVMATFLNAFGKIEFRFISTFVFGLLNVAAAWLVLRHGVKGLNLLPGAYAICELLFALPVGAWILARKWHE